MRLGFVALVGTGGVVPSVGSPTRPFKPTSPERKFTSFSVKKPVQASLMQLASDDDVHLCGSIDGLRRIELGHGLGVEAFGELEWLSASVTDYYYGVTSGEATASRPFYQPGSSLDLVAGLHFNYDFGRKSTILFGYEASILGPAAANSPIVQTKFNNLVLRRVWLAVVRWAPSVEGGDEAD